MKAIITKLETGHLIEIENGGEKKSFAVGKFHAVVSCLTKNFKNVEPNKVKNDDKVKIK